MMDSSRQTLSITKREMEKRRAELFKRGDASAMRWLLRLQYASAGGGGADSPVHVAGASPFFRALVL